jgi:hypothetical protein
VYVRVEIGVPGWGDGSGRTGKGGEKRRLVVFWFGQGILLCGRKNVAEDAFQFGCVSQGEFFCGERVVLFFSPTEFCTSGVVFWTSVEISETVRNEEEVEELFTQQIYYCLQQQQQQLEAGSIVVSKQISVLVQAFIAKFVSDVFVLARTECTTVSWSCSSNDTKTMIRMREKSSCSGRKKEGRKIDR